MILGTDKYEERKQAMLQEADKNFAHWKKMYAEGNITKRELEEKGFECYDEYSHRYER
jgi:hypothetical protein